MKASDRLTKLVATVRSKLAAPMAARKRLLELQQRSRERYAAMVAGAVPAPWYLNLKA